MLSAIILACSGRILASDLVTANCAIISYKSGVSVGKIEVANKILLNTEVLAACSILNDSLNDWITILLLLLCREIFCNGYVWPLDPPVCCENKYSSFVLNIENFVMVMCGAWTLLFVVRTYTALLYLL